MEGRVELQLLSAFVDEALDLSRQLEVQACTEQDARIRSQVRGLRQLRVDVRAYARRYVAPAALVVRLRGSSGLGAGKSINLTWGSGRRWFSWQSAALVLGEC